MKRIECAREPDLLDAIASGRWPARADAELRVHVGTCDVCADVAEVVPVLAAEQSDSCVEARHVPPVEVVWLRAQTRARLEASRVAVRPITAVQAIGAACALGALAAVIYRVTSWSSTVDWLANWLAEAAALLGTASSAVLVAPVIEMPVISLALRGAVLAVGLWLVLAPIAVYLVATDD